MKNLMSLAVLAGTLFGGSVVAQQPAQPKQPQAPEAAAPAPREGARMRRPFPTPGGMAFSPTMLLERRQALSLTTEQVTRLSTLENEVRAAREKAEADAKPHREELEKQMKQDTPDVGQVRTHAQAVAQAEQAGRLAALVATAQAKAVLTAEQRGRVQGWLDSRQDRREGRGRGELRRPGPGNAPGGGMPRRPADPRFRSGRAL